jgi:hypothetical protein
MESNLKVQAAIGGVLYYLKSEEESTKILPHVIQHHPNPWQLNARTSIMQMRGLLQRRVLKRY